MEISLWFKTNKVTNMIVKNIKWISKTAEEAEVEISDGEFTCIAFSQPCNANIGDTIKEPLHVFSIKNAMLCEGDTALGIFGNEGTGLSRKVIARVVDVSEQLIAVGRINLTIEDYLPGGIRAGDLIEFDCARIDLW
jgi:hypothetical protein